ncbi:nucleotidyltransferase domain-containing protein [Methylomonas sp. HYX-M1]|uniref:nucleotidyltransferase domain-containing protein n=1 Tax=Methylomonas sp. HYX-M1 TaxID=3139307 RepID=UPI00345B844F
MPDKLLLREQDRRRLRDLLVQHLPGVTAWAYGSRVNGDAHDASDLDIVLRSADLDKIPLKALERFQEAVRESNIPILIEARDWARLPESFHREILRDYVELGE